MVKTNRKKASSETDSTFFLKLLMYLIIGSQWLHITNGSTYQISLPIGVGIGLVFAVHEHFKIDRKIEFAVLLVAMFVGFWVPNMGLSIIL